MMGISPLRRLTVRLYLLFVAAVLVIPGVIFSGTLLEQFAQRERAENRADLLSATTRLAGAVDRELGVLMMSGRVLALSQAAADGDLVAFTAEARAAAGVLGQTVFLAAPDGRVLVNTSDGALELGADATGAIQRVGAERAPFVSGLLDRTAHPRVLILSPVLRGGRIMYVVGFSLDPAFLSAVIRRQAFDPGWFAALRDRDGRLVARSQPPERFIGTEVPPGRASPVEGQGITAVETLGGVKALAAASTIPSAEWRATVAVSRELVDGPVRRSELWLALMGAGETMLGIVLAWHLAGRISRPLSKLAQAGRDLGAGRDVAPVRTHISEVQDVSAALTNAHRELLERSVSLAAERARLAAIIETVPVGLLIADATGTAIAGNRQLARMLARDQLARDGGRFLGATDEAGQPVPDRLMPLPRALAGEDPAELCSRIRRPDGTLFWAQAVAAPIVGREGEVTGAVLALLDIDEAVCARQQKERWADQLEAEVRARTDELERANRQLLDEVSARSRAEDQLRQAQKMEAVGRLTGGIAHDFNNLLTVILGSLELLSRRVSDPRALLLVESATDGANRAAELTSRLLAFSRRQPLLPQKLDVNQLVDGMTTLLNRSLGETIIVETALAHPLWHAMADPNQLESALLNLAVNARDAILEVSPGGGRLRIETAAVSIEPGACNPSNELRPGDYVMIATIDSGSGMSPETLAQAFEPFFTTKSHGKGTGLGLSQVHGFAVQSGGYVSIESKLGHGTTVRLFLPRALGDAPVGSEPSLPPVTPPSEAGLVFLLVEDEPAVRQFTAEALRLLGYEVLEACDGLEALDLLGAHPEIALMITDVVMPGMNGRELAREVERRRPGLPILLASGYSRVAEEPEDTRWELLPKPFTVTALADKVEMILRGHADRVADGDPAAFDHDRVDA